MTVTFYDRLLAAWDQTGSQLVVGLDPDRQRLPAALANDPNAFEVFCRGIVDATAPYVCGFKPQIAYFAAEGAETVLERLCDYIRSTYPHLLVILDAKRGDIGSTAHQYAREAFERYHAHAVTVNPYMGLDSIRPYLSWRERGVIVLCRTSNPGSADFQALPVGGQGQALYLHVAAQVANQLNAHQQCALVVGATYPDELAQVRACVGDLPLLIPGIGAQGADLAATVRAGRDSNGLGMLLNSSRAVLYASASHDWQQAAAEVAHATREAIKKIK